MNKKMYLALAGWLLAAGLAQAQISYVITNGAAQITGFSGGGAVVIPASTNGYPVTAIQSGFYNQSSLTSVSIPASVTNIDVAGSANFLACISLTNITVAAGNPNYASTNGALISADHTVLLAVPAGLNSNFTVPGGITTIGGSAFYFCINLPGVTLPEGLLTIGASAFAQCYNLTTLTLPASLTNISTTAFGLCVSVTNFTVAAGNAYYSSLAGVWFDHNQTTLLAYPEGRVGGSYSVPATVTNIASAAFLGTHLTNVALDANLKAIGDGAFSQCPLTQVVIPDSVTYLGVYAFDNASQLTSVTLGAGLQNIPIEAFYQCPLTSLTIPNGVTNLDFQAFAYCTSLTNVIFGSGLTSLGNDVFYGCSKLGSVVIPDTVTNLASYAFGNCTSLTNVVVGSGVTRQNYYSGVFAGCTGLKAAYFRGNAPSPTDPIFFSGDLNAVVYYPSGSTGWGATFDGLPTAAYQLNVTPVPGVTLYGGQPAVFFPASATNYVLQMTTNLAGGNWVTVSNGYVITGIVLTNAPANAFFRLH